MPIDPWWETNPATTLRQELGMASPELIRCDSRGVSAERLRRGSRAAALLVPMITLSPTSRYDRLGDLDRDSASEILRPPIRADHGVEQ